MSVSLVKDVRPIDVVTLSNVKVNDLDVTISDITLAYLNVAAAYAVRTDATHGVVSVADLTEGAILQAEADVWEFVVRVKRYVSPSAFANLMGAEIGEILFNERNGRPSVSTIHGAERSEAIRGTAWNMGMLKLRVQEDGTVDWF